MTTPMIERSGIQFLNGEKITVRRVLALPPDFPIIVVLCGSTKFWREYQRQNLRFTSAGVVVLSIGAATGTDDEHFGNLDQSTYDSLKMGLDELHKRKIDLADYVFVINPGGYVGDSTRGEIAYALAHGKTIEYLEDPNA